MLLNLRIENFALIDALELQFGYGLNVLTGETGAGKSIILDAIDAALGGKVSSRVIRTGMERSLVEATFQLTPSVAEWLERNEIDGLDEASLICSRELSTAQGSLRSRSRLNGVLVNKQQMEDLRNRLVEMTAQGQTVQLGHPAMQRQWLDSFAGDAILPVRDAVAIAFAAWHQTQQAIETCRHSEHQRLQRLDILEFQVKELRSADLNVPDELEALEQERQRLSHSVELQQQSYHVYQALYQNDQGGVAVADLLGRAENTLTDMLRYDAQVQPILELVSAALAQVEEAGREISSYGDGLETDPERLQTVEERIGQLKQVCRKYGPTLNEAIAHYQAIETELTELTSHDQSLAALEQISQQQAETLQQASAQLTILRKTAAHTLQSQLIDELKPLAMEKVQFQVEMTPCLPTATGADRITFLFSPNPGEPLQPLTEIASGGEMSRFLLALKTCFVGADVVGTLVFDEIDVGVSGRVTQAIAQKLHQLSQHHQVLCVTHQAIVAAMADQHFRVNKQVTDALIPSDVNATTLNGHGNTLADPDPANLRTIVRVTPLDQHQRRDELAQLAGGQSDQKTIAFADSLLAQAASSRQNPPTAASTQSKGTKRTRLPSKRKSAKS
jgi:DNA repair protein RecN (Recombination protein N)